MRCASGGFVLWCCVYACVGVASDAAAQDDSLEQQLGRYDRNVDMRLDREELIAFFLANDKTIADMRAKRIEEARLREEAALRADDALSYKCGDCESVPLDRAAAFVRETIRTTSPRKFRLGWKGLSFRRFATDPADARQLGPDRRPTLFSYKRDTQAKDRDQVNWLGGLQLFRFIRNIDSGDVRHHFLIVTPGIEADIDGSKAANESSLDFAVPVTYEWERGARNHLVSGVAVTVTPKRLTDRGFDRKGWEVSTEVSATSLRLLRMGYTTAISESSEGRGAALLLSWKPSLRFETGEITDAAGNSRLAVLQAEGTYFRVAPRLTATVRSERVLPGLSVGLDYFHRFRATTSADYSYGELRFVYDLTSDRSLSFGVVVTRGNKPPDFSKTDRILIGIGFLQ